MTPAPDSIWGGRIWSPDDTADLTPAERHMAVMAAPIDLAPVILTARRPQPAAAPGDAVERRRRVIRPRVLESVDLGPKLRGRILALDPARAAVGAGRRGDRFGVAVIESWSPVHVVTLATTLPPGLDTHDQAGVIFDLLDRIPVDYLIVDGRGPGVGVVDELRRGVEPSFARTRVIAAQVTGGTAATAALRFTKVPEGTMASISKAGLVETTAGLLEHDRLVLDPHLPDDQRREVERQVDLFTAEDRVGGTRYGSTGKGVDDVLSAIMLGAVLAQKKYGRPGAAGMAVPTTAPIV